MKMTMHDTPFDGNAIPASKLPLNGMDFCAVNAEDPHSLQSLCWKTHLPLALQTHFVERGVKPSSLVAAMDRREESRLLCMGHQSKHQCATIQQLQPHKSRHDQGIVPWKSRVC